MTALISEIVKYSIKYVCMIICAGLGIAVGKALKKKKDANLANETSQQ